MFVFSAMLAVKAMACGRTDVVENIIEWASDYLEHERFSNWINQHGGWVSSQSERRLPQRQRNSFFLLLSLHRYSKDIDIDLHIIAKDK